MSRSYRKTPIRGKASTESEKKDKQLAHRTLRARFRTQLAGVADLEGFAFNEANIAHSDRWGWAKDGRGWIPLQTRRIGRALRTLSRPDWVKSLREAHKQLAK